MTDDQELLASAYLDGALTGEERARAESDPEVMAAVEQMREVRQALAVVAPPDPTRREAAITAALDVFDGRRRPATPAVVSLRRHRAGGWLISAAAAALVLIVAGGILAVKSGQGDDDDQAAGGAATTEVANDANAEARATGEAPGGAERTTDQEAAQTTSPAAAPSATALSDRPTVEGTLNLAVDAPLLTSVDDLSGFAEERRSMPDLSTAEQGRSSCNQGRWLGPARYVVDGVETPVDVFLARRAGVVRAVDPETCDVVATAPAP